MYDLHTHSLFSFDCTPEEGGITIEQMCERGISIGLKGLAITDHYEIFSDEEKALYSEISFDLKKSKEAVERANEKFEGRFRVLYGIELGSPSHNPSLAQEIVGENRFDFVIVSSHRVAGIEDFWFVDYANSSDKALLGYWDRYLEELHQDISLGIGDTAAHITYPYRYYKHNEKGHLIDLEGNYRNYYTSILNLIIEKELALEINTSGLRYYLHSTLPTKDIIALYQQLGGKYVTIGSDAHKAEDLGQGFDTALSYLTTAKLLYE